MLILLKGLESASSRRLEIGDTLDEAVHLSELRNVLYEVQVRNLLDDLTIL